MHSLPAVDSDEVFDTLDLDAAPFTSAAREVARRIDCEGQSCERIRAGSLPVFAVGDDVVLKFFPPYWRAEGEREARILRFLHGRLPAPTPELLGREELDGWEALVLRRLAGRTWADMADRISPRNQIELVEDAGRLVAALHALDARALALEDEPWPAFVAAQSVGAVGRQEQLGLDPYWTKQIDAWLADVELDHEPQVLLHTEVMREHLFVEERNGHWCLSGLLDFEPSRIGAAEYELASAGLFVACGEAALLRAFLCAYGYEEAALDRDLQRRCMAWALLHRYSHLPWYLRRFPVEGDAPRIDDLAARWWPLT